MSCVYIEPSRASKGQVARRAAASEGTLNRAVGCVAMGLFPPDSGGGLGGRAASLYDTSPALGSPVSICASSSVNDPGTRDEPGRALAPEALRRSASDARDGRARPPLVAGSSCCERVVGSDVRCCRSAAPALLMLAAHVGQTRAGAPTAVGLVQQSGM